MTSFRLTMAQGPNPGKVFDLVKDISTIGRDVSNDIVINDAEVSRHHARITAQAGGHVIEDLSSTNGTFVNGQRVVGPRPLARGDVVGLGETVTLSYEVVASPSTQATLVGSGAPAYQPPKPAYAPPPPQYAPPPSPTPPPQAAPRARSGGQSRTGLYVGLGCGCLLLLLVACAGIGWYMDANYPDILYAPLAWFGF